MINGKRHFAPLIQKLKKAGLRPTRQRLALARILFTDTHRHVTAEELHNEALRARVPVALATVYNTLHQFTAAGFLREVVVAPGCSYFDTNVSAHHHFFYEGSGTLSDIPNEEIVLHAMPAPPAGTKVRQVEVIVRLSDEKSN